MRRLLIIGLVSLLAVAGCAEVEDENGDDSADPTPTATEVTESTDEESDPTPTVAPEPTEPPEEDADEEVAEEDQATATPEVVEEEAEATEPPADEAEDDVPEEIAGDIDVHVLQQNSYSTSFGSFDVFGEIENSGEGHAELQEVLITLRAEDGSVVDSGDATAYISVVEGGNAVPFHRSFLDVPEDDVAEIEIDIEARDPEEAWLRIFEHYREFETLQADWNPGEFNSSIVGEIENVGDETAELVQIFAAGYDNEGGIQFVQTTFAERDLIRPGDTSPFTIDFLDEALEEPAEIRVNAEGWITDAE